MVILASRSANFLISSGVASAVALSVMMSSRSVYVGASSPLMVLAMNC
jgi:hypothetical protein